MEWSSNDFIKGPGENMEKMMNVHFGQNALLHQEYIWVVKSSTI